MEINCPTLLTPYFIFFPHDIYHVKRPQLSINKFGPIGWCFEETPTALVSEYITRTPGSIVELGHTLNTIEAIAKTSRSINRAKPNA